MKLIWWFYFPESGLDLDPHSSNFVDPDPYWPNFVDPDPHTINADPHHCFYRRSIKHDSQTTPVKIFSETFGEHFRNMFELDHFLSNHVAGGTAAQDFDKTLGNTKCRGGIYWAFRSYPLRSTLPFFWDKFFFRPLEFIIQKDVFSWPFSQFFLCDFPHFFFPPFNFAIYIPDQMSYLHFQDVLMTDRNVESNLAPSSNDKIKVQIGILH